MSLPAATASTTSLVADPSPPKLTRTFSLPSTSSQQPAAQKPSWREKMRARHAPPVPGKEKWRDATLSEKERWKEWHKAKDRERAAGSTAGFYSGFYKAKGGWVWAVGLFG